MDENKKYHNPDDDGINNESDNDTYDPYEEYVKDKVHEEQKEEYGDSYARYTDPQMGDAWCFYNVSCCFNLFSLFCK